MGQRLGFRTAKVDSDLGSNIDVPGDIRPIPSLSEPQFHRGRPAPLAHIPPNLGIRVSAKSAYCEPFWGTCCVAFNPDSAWSFSGSIGGRPAVLSSGEVVRKRVSQAVRTGGSR